jgi:hypothetical protein
MKAIHLLRRVMDQYQIDKKDLHLVFINLGKACEIVPREILWKSLERNELGLPIYIWAIKDMYEGVSTSVRLQDEDIDDLSITI